MVSRVKHHAWKQGSVQEFVRNLAETDLIDSEDYIGENPLDENARKGIQNAFQGLQVHDAFLCPCEGENGPCRAIFRRARDVQDHIRKDHAVQGADEPLPCLAQRLNNKSPLFQVRVEGAELAGNADDNNGDDAAVRRDFIAYFRNSLNVAGVEATNEDVRDLAEWEVALQTRTNRLLRDPAVAQALVRGPWAEGGGLAALELATFHYLANAVKDVGILPFGIALFSHRQP
jgi:hypothetical protein